jgi:hypothetical protein
MKGSQAEACATRRFFVQNAAVGFRVHSGWSALTVVALEAGKPVVLCRKRMQLVETFSYTFRQPYHTAAKMPPEDAREFIASVKSQAQKMADASLRELQGEIQQGGLRLAAGALLQASGRALPALEAILGSHALIHTADGELFREALAEACARCGIALSRSKEKNLVAEAAQSLGATETALLKNVTELGRGFGAPWSQDEKFATLAAWLVLHHSGKAQRPKRQKTKPA